MNDEDLMIAAAQGDKHAFEQIVLRHQGSVWRVAWRYIHNAEEARDIAQSVFLKLFEASPRYKRTASFRTYLYKIVTTTCFDFIRKKRPVILDNLPEIQDIPPDLIEIDDREKVLRKVMAKLPARQKSAIVLRYDADLTIREIAEILKTTEKAVERLLAHARESLYHALNGNGAL